MSQNRRGFGDRILLNRAFQQTIINLSDSEAFIMKKSAFGPIFLSKVAHISGQLPEN